MIMLPRNSRRNHGGQGGFTLVELLIVVIILGILAAVVLPQFNSATAETRESALASNLATVRQAIEMYKVQHNDVYPNSNLVTQLTTRTDASGAAGVKYGPYLRGTFPRNPISGSSAVKVVATIPGSVSGTEGWVYATGTGEFKANVGGAGPSGVDYFDL